MASISTVGQGEFLVLLGPTGAGTLRLFAGLETPDAGQLRICDATLEPV